MKTESQANMRMLIVFGVVYFCVLVGKSSSWEVSYFRWVTSDNNEVMCATSSPNKTVNAVGLRSRCLGLCSRAVD